ncbi:Sugar baby [Carabus blaptoides fortunei]
MIPTINLDLLPMKGHYLFFNAATAPIVPFLPTIARQLGFSGTIVGIIYTVLTITGMFAKPIMGGIADRFHSKKLMFLLFQVVTAVSMLGINFISEIPTESKVHFACDNGAAVFDTSVSNKNITDNCAPARIAAENGLRDILHCQMSCEVPNASIYKTVCENWKSAKYCLDHPEKFEFTAQVPVDTILLMDENMFFRVPNVTMLDGSTVKPICPNAESSISTVCDMTCDSHAINSLISETRVDTHEYLYYHQFWLFLMLAIFVWVGMAVVVSVGDAICFEKLGDKPNLYGNQRLWGSIGWGTFSIIAGFLVDANSEGETKKNYSSAFYLMLVMMGLDVLVSSRLKYNQINISNNILRDVGKLISRPRIVVFLCWCAFVGACTGCLWQFQFWLLEDLARLQENNSGCDMHLWIKTLEGLVMGIQCLGGELPFFFLSGWILKRIGHIHCMSIVLLGIGIRYVLYSTLVDPWWVLPIELLNGVTFGLFYATMASYASIAAPPGTEATIQGLVGAVFEGVGMSLGNTISGVLYDKYGGWTTFKSFGIVSLILCFVHILIQRFLLSSSAKNKDFDEETSTRYAPPKEAIRILDEENQELALVRD